MSGSMYVYNYNNYNIITSNNYWAHVLERLALRMRVSLEYNHLITYDKEYLKQGLRDTEG